MGTIGLRISVLMKFIASCESVRLGSEIWQKMCELFCYTRQSEQWVVLRLVELKLARLL